MLFRSLAYLVHLVQRPLFHLLQSTDFSRILLSRQEYLAVPTLADLGDDMELIDFEFGSSSAQEDALAATVGFEFLRILQRFQIAGGRIAVEFSASFLARGEVSQSLKVVIQEIFRC